MSLEYSISSQTLLNLKEIRVIDDTCQKSRFVIDEEFEFASYKRKLVSTIYRCKVPNIHSKWFPEKLYITDLSTIVNL